jgi:hypothetical protein
VQGELGRALFEPGGRDLLEQGQRVVIEISPSRGIELAEQARGVRVPAPPEVLRQRVQPLMRRRDELASLTMGASCAPAITSIRTSTGSKTRGSMV